MSLPTFYLVRMTSTTPGHADLISLDGEWPAPPSIYHLGFKLILKEIKETCEAFRYNGPPVPCRLAIYELDPEWCESEEAMKLDQELLTLSAQIEAQNQVKH